MNKTKKTLVGIYLFVLIVFTRNVWAQQEISSQQWMEDLDYLVAKIEIMHPDCYANIDKEVFASHVTELRKRIPNLSDEHIVVAFQELIARIGDMHTGLMFWEAKSPLVKHLLACYPVAFKYFSDGLFIYAADETLKDTVGKKVIAFGNVPAGQLFRNTVKVGNGDNPIGKVYSAEILSSLAIVLDYCGVQGAKDELKLTLQNPDGSHSIQVLNPEPFDMSLSKVARGRIGRRADSMVYMYDACKNPLPLYLQKPNDKYWYTYVPEMNAIYVSLIEMDPKSHGDFERFYQEVLKTFDEKQAERLILDVRFNDGGDHFEMPLVYGIISRPELNQPDKLFVLQGRMTGSASQHFVTQFSMYTNATFIGEETGGKPNHFGAQRQIVLPNSKLTFRTSIIFHQDDTEWNNELTARPDYYAPFDSEAIVQNSDPAIELITNYDHICQAVKNIRKNLCSAYTTGGIESLKEVFVKEKQSAFAKTINWEKLMYDLIFDLFDAKISADDYAEYLRFFAMENRESDSAWFVLAEYLLRKNKLQEASECYEKCLAIYPGHSIAARRLANIRFDLVHN